MNFDIALVDALAGLQLGGEVRLALLAAVGPLLVVEELEVATRLPVELGNASLILLLFDDVH